METNMNLAGAVHEIDDFGRLLLPINLRSHLDWHPGDWLVPYTDTDAKMMFIHKNGGKHIKIDSHGRILITPELQSELDWQPGSKIVIIKNGGLEQLVLQSTELFRRRS